MRKTTKESKNKPESGTTRSDINLYTTLANSTPIRNGNTRSDQPGVHFNTNPIHQVYPTTSDGGNQYEPPENDSILQGATSSPVDQFVTNATDAAGRNKPWRRINAISTSSNTINHRTATRPTGCNLLQNENSSNPPDLRNAQKACRKQHNNIPSPTHSQIPTCYHPTVTPPPLMGTTAATQPTGTHNNPLFNLLDNNQPRTSTIMHTPHNSTSLAMPADLVLGITQIMNQVTSNNKRTMPARR